MQLSSSSFYFALSPSLVSVAADSLRVRPLWSLLAELETVQCYQNLQVKLLHVFLEMSNADAKKYFCLEKQSLLS